MIGRDGHAYPNRKGAANAAWRGGRQYSGNGYIYVVRHDHPNADDRGRVYEHVAVAETALGKLLPPNAVVHHVDGSRSNNAKANLVICEDQAYHLLLHRRQRAREACGDANKLQCRFCKTWDDVAALHVMEKRKHGKPNGVEAYHRLCNAEAKRGQGKLKRGNQSWH